MFQDGFLCTHIDIFWEKKYFLLVLVNYYLQKRDALHKFKRENKHFYIFVLLFYYRNRHALKGSEYFHEKSAKLPHPKYKSGI